MAGRPKLRALGATVAKMGEERFWEMLLDIGSVPKMAEHLTKLGGQNFSRSLLYHWIQMDPDRKLRLRMIREAQSHMLAEEALEILDTAEAASISVDRERARTRQWLAERWNRKEYGEEKAGVTVNVQNLHLSALQASRPAFGGAIGEGAGVGEERALPAPQVSSYVTKVADEVVLEGSEVEVDDTQEDSPQSQG